MAAAIGNQNSKGNSGGKSLQDRKLAAEVRRLALKEIKQILENKEDKELFKSVIIRLSSTVLPKLNEISGPDGEPLPLLGGLSNGKNNESDKQTTSTEEED